jgi:D-glycero-D-manno-heptose 1,7-bisphosphate phosphatase
MRAAIFDRDGTLIEHVHYLRDPAAVRLLPGVADGLRSLMKAGVPLYIHTNQSGIGRGYFTMADAEACNQRLIELLDLGSTPFRRICIAPERPDQPSEYRKPSPRFAREVATELGCNPANLCYLGDRGSDLATASAAGTQGIGITTGLRDLRAELAELQLPGEFSVCSSFAEAIALFLALPSRHAVAPLP